MPNRCNLRPSKDAVPAHHRQMSRPSTRRFAQFSADWQRLTTRRGLLAGVIGSALNLIGFLLVFALLLRWGGLGPVAWSQPSDAAFWGAVFASVVAGAGYVGLATVDRMRRMWRTLAGGLATLVILYGGFALLSVAAPSFAFFGGFGFVIGRVVGHGFVFLRGRTDYEENHATMER